MDIAKKRMAYGEISMKEYENILEDLNG